MTNGLFRQSLVFGGEKCGLAWFMAMGRLRSVTPNERRSLHRPLPDPRREILGQLHFQAYRGGRQGCSVGIGRTVAASGVRDTQTCIDDTPRLFHR